MKYEAIIVGAGPAGAMAAFLLATRGRKVLLLERAEFPRAKVCGDCLNPRIQPLLEKYGLWADFQRLPQHVLQGLQIERDGNRLFRYPFFGDSFRSMARSTFDAWLVDRAQTLGVDVRFQTTVTELDPVLGRVTTNQGEFFGEWIFGADGRNSLCARTSGLIPPTTKCRRVGWQTTLELPELDGDVHMNVFPGGYYGLVRINSQEANLCLVLDARSPLKPSDVAARFFPSQKNLEWRSIHPIRRAPSEVTKGRLWLLGDTARVVEPFTGEGIYFALASAECASQTLEKGSSNGLNQATLSALYNRHHRHLYEGKLFVNRLTQWLLESSSRGYRALTFLKNQPALLRYATERVVLAG